MRRPPFVATLVVLLAVATMVGLGMWQIQRRTWKNAMLARYQTAETQNGTVEIAVNAGDKDLGERFGYRHVRWDCPLVTADQMVSGRNASGASGWAHVVVCKHFAFDYSNHAEIVLGWSRDPKPVVWKGGPVTGILVPTKRGGVMLPPEHHGPPAVSENLDWHIVADPPLAGLIANERPDPRDIPNNHWSYAIQWFAFAVIALVIYGMALRRR